MQVATECMHPFPHTADTNVYAARIRQCKTVQETRSLHRELSSAGADQTTFLCNLLIQAYGRSGSLEDAKRTFDCLQRRNVFSWSILLEAHVQHGRDKEALVCFGYMNLDGVHPDTYTFITVVRACTNLRDVVQGKVTHKRIQSVGLSHEVVLSNTLLNMYSKCGEIELARNHFESLPVRDVIAFTTMITGYAQNGHLRDSFALLERMKSEGIQANEVTYACVLDACTNIDEGASKVHELSGYDTGLVVGTAIVGMYGRCGSLEEARSIFNRMKERDVVTWRTMIAAYARGGHIKEAVQVFRLMNLDGVKPNEIIFMTVLGAFDGRLHLADGKSIHELVISCGLDDVLLRNTLIRMYGKCEDMNSARNVFMSMSEKNVITWTMMLAAAGDPGEALEQFYHMENEGVKPDHVTFLTLLDIVADRGDIDKCKGLHERIRLTGLESISPVRNSLINAYGKCRGILFARDLFDHTVEKCVFSWTAMITAYVENAQGKEALELFQQMERSEVEPDTVTLVSALDACGLEKDLETGRRIHGHISASSMESDKLETSLIAMYSKCGSLREAEAVFESRARGGNCTAVWNSMLAAYGQEKDPSVLIFYREMNLHGVKPDSLTYRAVLPAWECFKHVKELKEIHRHVEASGCESEVAIATALVHAYGKVGNAGEDARRVFDGVGSKDIVLWNAMLGAYAGSKQALELYEEMDLEPNETTYLSVLEACASSSLVSRGRDVHDRLVRGGYGSNVQVATSVVRMYAKCGRLDEARSVFGGMREKTVVTWTAMVCAYAEHGEGTQAMEVFWEMNSDGIPADGVAFLSVISSCSHSGLVKEGCEFFQMMLEEYDMKASVEHFAAVVDLLGRSGKINDARELMKCMPHGPQSVAWNAFLPACKTTGVSDVQPSSAGLYISLSNALSNGL